MHALIAILAFTATVYIIPAFIILGLFVLLFYYKKDKDAFKKFFAENYPMIILIIFLSVVSFFLIYNMNRMGIRLLDVVIFLHPLYKPIVIAGIILFFGRRIIHKVKDNVVLINYTELAIYFFVFLFFSWMVISALFSFNIVQNRITLYFTESKQLSTKYLFILYAIYSFIIITFLMFVYIMASRIVKTVFEIVRRYLRVQYQDAIIEYVYDSEGFDEDNVSFKFLKRHSNISRFRRSLIVRELTYLHRSLSGQLTLKTKEIYNKMGLSRDSFRALKCGSWPQKIKAMGELSLLNYKGSENEIKAFLSSKNEILRKEAQIALVKLNTNENSLDFLVNYKFQLTDYEQILLLHALKRNKVNDVDTFPLLGSPNHSVTIFGLRLIGVFGQTNNHSEVIPYLNHNDPKVCEASLYALKKLCLPETAEDMRDAFNHQTYNNKIKLLDVLEELSSANSREWLIDLISNSNEYGLKLAAMKVLNKTGKLNENIAMQVFGNNKELQPFIKHVTDNRI